MASTPLVQCLTDFSISLPPCGQLGHSPPVRAAPSHKASPKKETVPCFGSLAQVARRNTPYFEDFSPGASLWYSPQEYGSVRSPMPFMAQMTEKSFLNS